MDRLTLEALVTNEAKTQADTVIQTAEQEVLQYLTKEKNRLEGNFKEQSQKLTAEYESKKSFLFFTMESEYKKKLLQKKQVLMDQLAIVLHKNLLEMIRINPPLLLKKTLSQSPSLNGQVYVSQELSAIITGELIQQFNQKHGTSFEYIGVDPQLEPGMAIVKDTTRYIFALHEFIDTFIEKNHSDITKLLQI